MYSSRLHSYDDKLSNSRKLIATVTLPLSLFQLTVIFSQLFLFSGEVFLFFSIALNPEGHHNLKSKIFVSEEIESAATVKGGKFIS